MYLFFKRLFDIIMALILVIVLSPVLIVVSIYLIAALKGPGIIFKQRRVGLGNKPFNVYKFKTMLDTKDASGKLLPDEQRLTKTGLILRKYSLDELPQLFNILNGTMSFIGPRPLLVDYLPLYSYRQLRRHEVLPGISGWAQVNGRNAISWEQKFDYDVWYVDHMNFALDIKICLLTIKKVLRSEGISSANAATMERFTGTD
ncbi:MAG: sugar transferase [Bacteroidetes bacterium 46-16]|nr:MAG: sugar transferase [Bacteroidetes bacterium 46-16]